MNRVNYHASTMVRETTRVRMTSCGLSMEELPGNLTGHRVSFFRPTWMVRLLEQVPIRVACALIRSFMESEEMRDAYLALLGIGVDQLPAAKAVLGYSEEDWSVFWETHTEWSPPWRERE